jgi:hypothetical protein
MNKNNDGFTMNFKLLYDTLCNVNDKRENGFEKIIPILELSILRKFHTWQVENNLIVIKNNKYSIEETTSDFPLAIMTYIAIGEKMGANLEICFPEYKFANPKYSFPKMVTK